MTRNQTTESNKADRYQLYHANKFNNILTDEDIKCRGFHRQKDVKDIKSVISIIRYVVGHDKYKKQLAMGLVSNKKTMKKIDYYKKVKSEKWRAARRMERNFEKMGRENPDMKELSVW